jgi:hypothetical protein
MIEDYFGFLPVKWEFRFADGSISPIAEFDSVSEEVDREINEDGFMYPPVSRRFRLDFRTMEPLEEVSKTKRPALLHPVPTSHLIHSAAPGTTEAFRKGPGSFLMHLLAYLFGIRLQFHDWWFDSRIPMRLALNHNVHPDKETAGDFLSHCYDAWQAWPAEDQKLITNLLSMHSRAPAYEWDWERFTIEYMVFDGCWKLARRRHALRDVPHNYRINEACQRFGIPYDDALAKKICDLRNELFHETLWDWSQPYTAVSTDAFMCPYHLRRLNQRLIPALLGYNNGYVKTGWWSLGSFLFGRV